MINSGKKYLKTWTFPYAYRRKHTTFLKIYNRTHTNIQVTYKIIEKCTYIHPKFMIDNTHDSTRKIEHHGDTKLNFRINDMKNVNIHMIY